MATNTIAAASSAIGVPIQGAVPIGTGWLGGEVQPLCESPAVLPSVSRRPQRELYDAFERDEQETAAEVARGRGQRLMFC